MNTQDGTTGFSVNECCMRRCTTRPRNKNVSKEDMSSTQEGSKEVQFRMEGMGGMVAKKGYGDTWKKGVKIYGLLRNTISMPKWRNWAAIVRIEPMIVWFVNTLLSIYAGIFRPDYVLVTVIIQDCRCSVTAQRVWESQKYGRKEMGTLDRKYGMQELRRDVMEVMRWANNIKVN